MQKKLIALAVAAAFSAPAFADTTVYGTLDAGYGNTAKTLTTPLAATPSVKSGQAAIAYSTMASSKLGFLASEDVAEGMKFAVKIETGIGSNPMAGVAQTGTKAVAYNGTTIDATSIGSRELWAALMLSSGTTIKAGYGSSLVRDISLGYAADPGGNLVGNLLNNDATLGSNRIVGVTVSQAFGPVTASVQVSKNTDYTDNKTDTQKNNGYLFGLQYADGPVSAGFAYQSLKNANPAVAAGAANTTGIGAPGAAAVAATDTTQKVTILAGSYDLSVAKIFAEYASIKVDDNLNALAVGTGKRTYESIGVDVPFGAVMGFAQLSSGKNEVATSATVAAVSRNLSGYTLGAKYNLNKTAYGYVSFGGTKLDAGAVAGDVGIKVDQYAIGLVKNF